MIKSSQVANLGKELEDARNIKQEVLDRGRSSAMKVELLNDELATARNRVQSLEKALVGARELFRVLQSGGNSSNTIQVSIPNNDSSSLRTFGEQPANSFSRTASNRLTPTPVDP